MNVARLGGVSVVLLAAACQGSIHMGSGAGSAGSPPSTGGPAPNTNVASRPAAPAPAPLPNPGVVAPVPTPTPTPTVNTAAKPQAHQIPRLKRLGLRQTPPPPATNAAVHKDPASLTRIRARTPAPCGPTEVAPGIIVTIDCLKYQPVTKAKFVSPLRRLALYKKGQLVTDGDSASNKGGAPVKAGGNSHTVGDATPRDLPATVDHRVDGTEGPVKDQDVVGSCTGFSLSTTVDNAIRRLNNTGDVISSMHIWSHYGFPQMSTAGDSNYLKPLALWADYPYDPKVACRMYSGPNQFSCGAEFDPNVQQNTASGDPAIQAQIAAADGKGKYKITNITQVYNKYNSSGPVDTDALAAILASGKDIWVAMSINSSAWGMRSTAGGEIPDWPDGPGGGHAVVIAGYRPKNGGRQFLIHNSWTDKWGGPEKGYAWLSDTMVKQALNDSYTIAITDVTAPPPPPPPPPTPNGTCQAGYTTTPDFPTCQKICKVDGDCGAGSSCGSSGNFTVCAQDSPLTDDDCADDELVDDVTKKCAVICPDDTRQHNSKCTPSATGGGGPKH